MSFDLAAWTDWINIALAIGICLACTSIAAKMTRETRCAVRFGIVGLFAGAIVTAAGGIWEFGDWVQTVYLAGALIYLCANLRSPLAVPHEAWSNRLAIGIAALVGVVLVLHLPAMPS